jgi:hypothetical protein
LAQAAQLNSPGQGITRIERAFFGGLAAQGLEVSHGVRVHAVVIHDDDLVVRVEGAFLQAVEQRPGIPPFPVGITMLTKGAFRPVVFDAPGADGAVEHLGVRPRRARCSPRACFSASGCMLRVDARGRWASIWSTWPMAASPARSRMRRLRS